MSKAMKSALMRFGLGAVGVALLALLPTSSFAAPLGGANRVQAQSSVAQADYRCWWSYGERQCAWFGDDTGPRVYGYYYGPYPEVEDDYYVHPRRPESFPPGSQRWWKSMERWGRSGGGTP
jgi:hypothetical protein